MALVDLASLSDGIALFKSGMDGIRTALGIWKEIRVAVPESDRAEFDRAIELSEKQLQIAEAQIAKGLGYALCHCKFPPTPMLTIGWKTRMAQGAAAAVHRCPACGITDNAGWGFDTTEAIRSRNPPMG